MKKNAQPYPVDGEIGRLSFETYHKENAYGEVLYNTSREFFCPLQGEETYCTEGFKEIALIDGATEESYRQTSALLNRIRHQEEGGTPSRTIRETTEREGWRIQDHLEQTVRTIFQACELTPAGRPRASILASLALPSRAFRKSFTSRLAHSTSTNPHNHGGLVVWKGQNNLVRIYETDY